MRSKKVLNLRGKRETERTDGDGVLKSNKMYGSSNGGKCL